MIIPVVLCGGSGTRLWPLSRKSYPKQLVDALGPQSLFQETVQRLQGDNFAKPIVISGQDYRFLIAEQLKELGVKGDIVLEPEGRDTFPAILAAAHLAVKRDPEATVLVMPSDHVIPDAAAFASAAAAAERAAAAGDIVTFGISPTWPASAYGYIRPAETLDEGHRIAAFIEKPKREKAERLIKEGCLWNAGLFCFRASALLERATDLDPDCVTTVGRAVEEASEDLDYLRLGPVFAEAHKISFDYAVMEKTDSRRVIPVDFAWSDVGDWRELWAMSEKDDDGNAVSGDVLMKGVKNSYIRSESRLVCALGLEGIAVIDTQDALLVAPLEKAQEVKGLAQGLEKEGRSEATIHARVYRPWGWYQGVDAGPGFQVKRIAVYQGRQLSLQKHFHRSEHWVVVRGTAEVTVDNEVRMLHENESVYIPLGSVHRLGNPGRIPVELIEVQTGTYLGEDDIVRLEDDFGRA